MAALKSIEVNSCHEPDQKEGISAAELDSIIAIVLSMTKDYSLACLLSFGFTGFFRQSNMIPRSAALFGATRNFTRADVRPSGGGLQVKVKWTKTIKKYREATSIYLPEILGRPMCPVTAHKNVIIRVPTIRADQPLFSFPDGTPLTLPYVNKAWKGAVAALGLDPSSYSLHSLRLGGASAVWDTGLATPTDIMRHGTWSSQSWRAYTHRAPPASTVVAGLSSLAK